MNQTYCHFSVLLTMKIVECKEVRWKSQVLKPITSNKGMLDSHVKRRGTDRETLINLDFKKGEFGNSPQSVKQKGVRHFIFS